MNWSANERWNPVLTPSSPCFPRASDHLQFQPISSSDKQPEAGPLKAKEEASPTKKDAEKDKAVQSKAAETTQETSQFA